MDHIKPLRINNPNYISFCENTLTSTIIYTYIHGYLYMLSTIPYIRDYNSYIGLNHHYLKKWTHALLILHAFDFN